MSNPRRSVAAGLLCALTVTAMYWMAPSSAAASPWTLGKDQLAIVARYDAATADEEFLDNGGSRAFPLNGKLTSVTVAGSARYGLRDDFELSLDVPVKFVSYTSDPVIVALGDDTSGLDFFQDNVLNFSHTTVGLADIEFGGTYQVVRSPVAVAASLVLKTPTGYTPPTGTFGDSVTTIEGFEANTERLVNQDHIEDDVPLGDGQVDITPKLEIGWAASFGFFARAGGGFRLRLGGAANQVVANGAIGQALGQRLLLYAGAEWEKSIEDGKVIGISASALDPGLPATEYGGEQNLALRELRLERDELVVRGGAIVRITDAVEVNAGYAETVDGRNTTHVRTITIGIGLRTDLSVAPPP